MQWNKESKGIDIIGKYAILHKNMCSRGTLHPQKNMLTIGAVAARIIDFFLHFPNILLWEN